MRRREFVAGGIALAAGKAAFPASTWAQPAAPRIDRIIDAHCHVFNAADLPIEGFARKIMVPRSAQTSELVARFADYPGALEALVHAPAAETARACMASSDSTRCDRLSMTIISAKVEIKIRSRSCAAPLRFTKSSSATRPRRRADSSVLSSTRRWDFRR